MGWRGAFFCLVPVALVAFIWQGVSLPSMPPVRGEKSSGNVLHLFKNPLVAFGMAACGLFFMGQFALFTYLRPFLETVTRVNVSTLSLILLSIGIAGFIGTLIIGSSDGGDGVQVGRWKCRRCGPLRADMRDGERVVASDCARCSS